MNDARWLRRAGFWRWGIVFGLLLGAAASAGVRQEEARLSLEEAREYMLELINRDRATKDLPPLQLDPIATRAGQKHAEEMAQYNYLSHWNREGKPPTQRYTEAGGVDQVQENVYLRVRFVGDTPAGPFKPNPEPTFTRREIQEVEEAYFNQFPPNDGHRRNILNPHHTHVGIGLASAGDSRAGTLANAQEFVCRRLEVDPMPKTASVGDEIEVSGRVRHGVQFMAISVGREPLPQPMSLEALKRTRYYSMPKPFVTYWPEPFQSPRPVQVTEEGRFRVRVKLSDGGRPGLYSVAIWARDARQREFVASQRTIVVK